ncbi:AMP-binding protein [Methylobacterium oryzae CBMB20]
MIPLFHVTGCHASLGAALYGGHRLVMMHRWDAAAALDLIEREGCTSAGGVPTIAWQLANAAREAGRPCRPWRASPTAAPRPPATSCGRSARPCPGSCPAPAGA